MRLICNKISCRTIQRVILVVISNRARASRSSDFEITADAITTLIYYKNYNLLDCDWFKKTPIFH